MAKPFLKWAGGKSQLLPEIRSRLPNNFSEEINTYVEPFLGGGAVFFYMENTYKFDKIILSDINPELVLCYRTIKENVEDLISELKIIQRKFLTLDTDERKEMYYHVRSVWNEGVGFNKLSKRKAVVRTSQMIFLNRTCFNGLFRVNSKGGFNVPIGSYKNPRILDTENLRSASKALQNAEIKNRSYEMCKQDVDSTTFVYFDPPYRPIDVTSSFTSYSKSGFNDINQEELATFFSELNDRKSKLMLSNSDPNDGFFDKLYSEFKICRVLASRNINSVGSKRGKVTEIIVTNYPHNAKTTGAGRVKQARLSQFEPDGQQ